MCWSVMLSLLFETLFSQPLVYFKITLNLEDRF